MSRWKVGDTQPHMIIDCFDANGERPDLSDATVVKLRVWSQGTMIIDRDVAEYAGANGVVDIPLQPDDVDTPGNYFAKIFAQWPDGTKQHYPPADQYMPFTVTR